MNLFEEVALQRSFFWGALKVLISIPLVLYILWAVRKCYSNDHDWLQHKLTRHFVTIMIILFAWMWFMSVEPMYRSTDVIDSTPIKNQVNVELKTVNPDSEESLRDKSKRLIDKSRKSNDTQKDDFLDL